MISLARAASARTQQVSQGRPVRREITGRHPRRCSMDGSSVNSPTQLCRRSSEKHMMSTKNDPDTIVTQIDKKLKKPHDKSLMQQ